jgi:outer membrane protein assembly factor BamB
MPDDSMLTELFARFEQPVQPPAAFATTLRQRLLADLAEDRPVPKENRMSSAGFSSRSPHVIPLPPPDPAVPVAAPRRWRFAVQLLSAAALLLTLAGGAYLGRGAVVQLAALWQTPENGPTSSGVPMAAVDPGRSGANPGPVPVGTPGLAWNAFAGVGAHPPIVVDGVAYVASDVGDIVAFDAASGSELWRTPLGGGTETPTYADGVLYVSVVTDSETGNSGGVLLALDADDGTEIWRMPTGTFGGTSPVVADGVVYAGGDQELYAFAADTGEQHWVYAIDAPPCVCNPRPAAVADGIVYVVPGGMQQASLFAIDAASGEERWRYDGQLAGESMRFTDPVVADDLIFVGEGALFAPADGLFAALDAETGRVVWTIELDASTSPAVADDVLYLQARWAGDRGGPLLMALDTQSAEPLWTVSTEEASLAQPAVADGLVLVPMGTREGYAAGFDDVLLVAFDGATGAEVWRVDLAGSNSGAPAIVGGVIYVTTYGEGALFALSESGVATPSPVTAIDLSGRASCLATPTGDPYAEARTGTPRPAVTSRGQWKGGVTAADMPAGDPASAEIIAAMNETLQALANCAGDEPGLLYEFFSDDYFARLANTMEVMGLPPDPDMAVTWHLPSFSPFADLTIREARLLPDGRAAGVFDGGFNPIFIVFTEQDGAWLIDELGAISDATPPSDTAATPAA